MALALALFSFVFGAFALGYGFITEWKQSRETGPVAVVATLPFAVAAALLVSLGIFPFGMPWWSGLLAFPVLTILFGKLILLADGRKR